MSFGLTQRQAAIVAAIGTFVTVLGAIALAAWFRRRNSFQLREATI